MKVRDQHGIVHYEQSEWVPMCAFGEVTGRLGERLEPYDPRVGLTEDPATCIRCVALHAARSVRP